MSRTHTAEDTASDTNSSGSDDMSFPEDRPAPEREAFLRTLAAAAVHGQVAAGVTSEKASANSPRCTRIRRHRSDVPVSDPRALALLSHCLAGVVVEAIFSAATSTSGARARRQSLQEVTHRGWTSGMLMSVVM